VIYLITVNYDSADLIATLIQSVKSTTAEYQFLIVNNSPADETVRSLAGDRVQILETGENLGFGGGCNVGLRWVYERNSEAIAWLLNPDTELPQGMVDRAIQFCQHHAEGSIWGTEIVQPDGKIWFAGGEFNPVTGRIVAQTHDPAQSWEEYQDTAWVTGCSLLLNLANFPACPQFDPAFFLYYEDFDFCRRYAHQGHQIGVTHRLQVIHSPSSITGRNLPFKLEHSTYSYLVALQRHTPPWTLAYRLGRILGRALRVSRREPETAIAIIKGVVRYGRRVSGFGQSHCN
jgi:N-acetylglucosaminyl-diphospho-decaprenol L-rhamnosyltransferase